MKLKAFINIGANAITMTLAETGAKDIRVIESLEQPAYIGHEVFSTGGIGNDAVNTTITTLKGYLKLLQEYGVDAKNVKVTATGSVRDADNADTFIDRIAVLTKLNVKIPEPAEINKTTYSLLKPFLGKLNLKPNNLLLALHLGYEDTELMGIKNGQVEFANIFRFGTLRIKSEIMATADPTVNLLPQFIAGFEKSLYRLLEPAEGYKKISLLLLGPEANFAAVCLGHTDMKACVKIQARSLKKILSQILDSSVPDYARRYNILSDEAENLASSLYITIRLMEEMQLRTAWVCPINLRDSIFMNGSDKPMRIAMDNQTLGSAWRILAHYNCDCDHAKSVLTLAKSIFKTMQAQHGLNGGHRLLLEVAAILHDSGTYVSHHAHHKHSAYLIENSDIFGLSQKQQNLVAQIARYHRRVLPQSGHEKYAALPAKEKNVVNKLAAILRVADALDNSHGDLLRNAKIYIENETLMIEHPNNIYAVGETISLGRKKDLFTKIFGMDVKLI